MEIVKLHASDYDEWLNVLNTTFSKQNNKEMNFEKELPKMCVRDDNDMGKHIAVKEDGKICALLGVYPFKVNIYGNELKFATVGNVATLPEYEGRGYMRRLMSEAMKELQKIGADASRLGGNRQRYNHYGYETSGYAYHFTINDHTAKYCADNRLVEFKKINADDTAQLEFINKCRKTEGFYVERSTDETYQGDYLAMCAWKNVPYIAVDENGDRIGYICSSESKTAIADFYAENLQILKDIIFGWQKLCGTDVTFSLMPWQYEAIKYFSSVAHYMSISSPSLFKIINFDKVADALIKLKASYTSNLPQGARVIGITGWGNLKISIEKNNHAYCEKTDDTPNIILDKLSATRLLFGPFSAETVVDTDEFFSSVLPLPLSWNTLDRV